MTSVAPIPVLVVTGFLGAGKTTLVDAWLTELGDARDVLVIVNELGAVGIDGAWLEGRRRALVELAGGCLCCTTQLAFARALASATELPARPSRILVETSGAASPAGVVRTITRTAGVMLEAVVTVVDPTRIERLAASVLAHEQLAYADAIVLSRADRIAPPLLDDAAQRIASWGGASVVVSADRGRIRAPDGRSEPSLDAWLARVRDELPSSTKLVAHPHATHETFTTVELTLDGELDEDALDAFFEDTLGPLEGTLLRAKGTLAIVGAPGPARVQGVQGELAIELERAWTPTERRRSVLVLVGIELDRAHIQAAFAACGAAGNA